MENLRGFDYDRIYERMVVLAGRQVRYFTKPGLPHWDSLHPGIALLAEHAGIPQGQRVLLFGAGLAPLGVYLAQQFSPDLISYHDLNIISPSMAMRSFAKNNLPDLKCIAEPDYTLPGGVDAAFMLIPKGRSLARRWLLNACKILKTGGALYLAGANDEGVQTIAKDAAEVFGKGTLLGYKKGCRALRFVKPASPLTPSWTSEQGVAPGSWIEHMITARGFSFQIFSLPGVFASEHLDDGTALLLEHLNPPPGCGAIDLGCGYGIIGLLLAKLGAGQVTLLDSNLLAVASAQKNITVNGIGNAVAHPGDVLSDIPENSIDYIASNPPFHSGKGVDQIVSQAFVRQAQQVLAPGGRFVMVANRFLPYQAWLDQVFHSVTHLAETGKYVVYGAMKR